uniref:Hypothetical conserved protein n=2 Tax=Candidatus Bipolaricaulota TaxID=67810 RepID=H5SHB9_9BACT|nr:hypothetical conserved protein [uncultured Acetothermia bacterium]BAL58950.1 hypothetical conserved protein [Candidatus Acetothermum autotrophicum]
MSQWSATKARHVLAALLKIGWTIKRQKSGSHRVLARPNWPDYVFAFHDDEEIGPVLPGTQGLSRKIYDLKKCLI